MVTSSGTVKAAIVSIHFDGPQDGVLVTESGSHCSTCDGGLTWTSSSRCESFCYIPNSAGQSSRFHKTSLCSERGTAHPK